MFRTFSRKFLPSRLEWYLRNRPKKILLGWNRGLGDLALGVFAIIHRIRERVPDAEIVVLTRENLLEGFSLLEGVKAIGISGLKRGESVDLKSFDVKRLYMHIPNPSPTDWCAWQYGRLTPKLKWDRNNDCLYEKFGLDPGFTYIGVQTEVETNYNLHRKWPKERWVELFERIGANKERKILLFGLGKEFEFDHPSIIDLRGKTTLLEALSMIRRLCYACVFPDSGLLSIVYYLNEAFPLRVVSLWSDPKQGILKQKVASPNPWLTHIPLIGENQNLGAVTAEQVEKALFPKRAWKPLKWCPKVTDFPSVVSMKKFGCMILAGGEGSRLGFDGPKGMFVHQGKTLFDHLLDKVPTGVPTFVMTSPQNHAATCEFLKDRNVECFQQTELPLLDAELCAVRMGPDGNGSFFESIQKCGLLERLKKMGVEALSIIPVENPLAHPADLRMIGRHFATGADVTIRCIERRIGDRLGLVVEEARKIGIVEYFDLHQEIGIPSYGYIGQVILSLSFIEKVSRLRIPHRWVQKDGLWKRERLLFDAFFAADQIQPLCDAREVCYAPIKGKESVAV